MPSLRKHRPVRRAGMEREARAGRVRQGLVAAEDRGTQLSAASPFGFELHSPSRIRTRISPPS